MKPIIQENISLKPYNTFGIDVETQFFTRIHEVETLLPITDFAHQRQIPILVLGGGSNLLFTQSYSGIILRNEIKGIKKTAEDSDHVWLTAGAGEQWHDLVLYCIKQGWGGVENLSLIPGTVGAAPIQNIGAYGVELKEHFASLEALNLSDGQIKIFNKEECQFGYRDSVFKNHLKNHYLITSVTLKLDKSPQLNLSYGTIQENLLAQGIHHPTIKDVSDVVINIRQSKLPDPKKIGNAGSFFKNPEISSKQFQSLQQEFPDIPYFATRTDHIKIPAAWLIEQCGWKGKRLGNIGVHEKQALVLVNYGNGIGDDIRKLAESIQTSVQEKFGILLTIEVNIIHS